MQGLPVILWAAAIAVCTTAASDPFYWTSRTRCPAACQPNLSSNSWTAYNSVDRLELCNETMLIEFAIFTPVGDASKRQIIKACTSSTSTSDISSTQSNNSIPSTCGEVIQTNVELPISWSLPSTGNDPSYVDVLAAAKLAQSWLADNPVDCQRDTIAFARSNNAVVGVFSGARLHSPATTVVRQFVEQLSSMRDEAHPESLLTQLCGADRPADHTLGIWADTSGNLESVQNAVASWANGTCFTDSSLNNKVSISVPVWTIGHSLNATTNTTYTPGVGFNSTVPPTRPFLLPRAAQADCSTIKVVSGDSCGSLASKCGISASDFTKYNSGSSLCSTLAVGQHVCCSSGSMPDYTPKPNQDGSCSSYQVATGDYCAAIIATNSIESIDKLNSFNNKTWGWTGCDALQAGTIICLSTGDPPMPATFAGVQCGPQVVGTTRPTNGTELADLNPCPLNACCDIWGQCGTTDEFCTISKSKTGNPGTAAPGENGCISNCGTDIVNNGDAPGSPFSVGYFEAFNMQRSCLTMDVRSVDRTAYSHLHFAFGTINPDYSVNVSSAPHQAEQFDYFKSLAGVKKVLSFGGWSFSTDPNTFPIFRSGVTAAQRALFAKNVLSFMHTNNLDGIDFDWEYPGAQDIPGVPPGSPEDGANYLAFLKVVRQNLPDGKTLSIAAPASYWYLKNFPIADISQVVDYVVFMTYDLHGQWDYGNSFSNPGCKNGNCLRSHVNLTETINALSMITKAGVAANKIVVGVASYGRSFQMTDPSCSGPMCTFTGPESGAAKGECTDTAGYISNAEIQKIAASDKTARTISARDSAASSDGDDSKTLIYGGNNWVSYMDDATKASRQSLYRGKNFLGSVEWAIDLQQFVPEYKDVDQGTGNETEVVKTPWRVATCENPWITDASLFQKDRWEAVGADDAWDEAIKSWKSGAQKPLSFIQGISNFLKGPENMQCGQTSDNNGCDTVLNCQSTSYPAGYFILNSLQQVSKTMINFYDGITNSESQMNSNMGTFSGKFAPIEDQTQVLKIALDCIGLGFALMAAPVWNIFLKESAYWASKEMQNNLGAIKDEINPLVPNGITIAKDDTGSYQLNVANKLETAMANLIRLWQHTITALNKQLFDGSDGSIELLHTMITDGKLLEPKLGPDDLDVQTQIERAVYAYLIPLAWTMSNKDIHPFVMDSGFDCSSKNPLPKLMTDADAVASSVCYKNKLYFLITASGAAGKCTDPACGIGHCATRQFSVPAGLSTMDGSAWGGLKRDDLVIGAVNSYVANGNKNNWALASPGNVTSVDALYDLGVQSPGVVQLSVCSPDVARTNWAAATIQGVDARNVPADYPCQPITKSTRKRLAEAEALRRRQWEESAKRC